MAILLSTLLVLWRASTLSLKLGTATSAAAVVSTGIVVWVGPRNSTIRILGLSLALDALRIGDWARDGLRRLIDIQVLFNDLGNGLNLSTKLLLDTIKVEAVFPVDQIDGQAKMTKSARATNAMQISFCVLGKVEVDDNIDGLDVDTTGQQIGTDKVPAHAIAKVVENAITVVLQHSGVRVEARVSELCNLLGKKFDTIRRVAEDD